MKILIIRFSSIGDIVLTTPVIRNLRKHWPEATLHYLTKRSFESILTCNPYLDKVYCLDADLASLTLDLVKEKYDYVIDLHHNLRTWYVKSLLSQAYNSNVRHSSVKKLNLRKWLLTTFKWNTLPHKSIVDRYMDTLKPLGVPDDGAGLDYYIPPTAQLKEQDLPAAHTHGFVACVLGGQHATKKLPLSKWKTFCEQFPYPIVLLGGREEQEDGTTLAQGDPVRIYNACGKFSLHESAAILRRAHVVITHDTGLMHIAAALRKPILSLWGNTVPAFGMYPYYGKPGLATIPSSYMLEVKNLSCRPCSKIGYAACPKKHFRCMQEIAVPQMLQEATRLLKGEK